MTNHFYYQREIAGFLERALLSFPVVVVTGLRQAGKTTLLRQDAVTRDRRYMTLDDFGTLQAARSEPEALLKGVEPLTFDEVQRCPELLVAIKKEVDLDRTPGKFLLSGSANLALLEGVSESLAGRALYLTLHPFTRREIAGETRSPFLTTFLAKAELRGERAFEPLEDREILLGGLPPACLGEARDPDLWFLGYEQTYLERDIRSLSQVADLASFRNLLRLASLRTAQVLNRSEIARDAGIPVSTVSRYLSLLETSFVLARLAPFLRNRATRLIRSPKLFIADSGLASHLTATRDISAASGESLRGSLYETYAYQNLAGILSAHLPEAELCFWSVQGRYEVDFVITHGRQSIALEVKAGSQFGRSDFAGLRAFLAKTPNATAGILGYNGEHAVALGGKLFAIPLGLLLS